MKHKILLIAIALVLAACTSNTPQPTATPIPFFTPSPVPTQTLASTETPAPAESLDLNPIYETPEIVEDIDGVQIKTKVVTDGSVLPTIGKVVIHEGWTNKNGRGSEAAIAEFIAKTFYAVWSKDHKGTYEEFMAKWSAAQNGTGAWEDVEITPFVNDVATPGYELKPTKIRPMFNGEGGVDKVVIAIVKESRKIINVEIVSPNVALGGSGRGVNIDGKTLYLYASIVHGGPIDATCDRVTNQTQFLPFQLI